MMRNSNAKLGAVMKRALLSLMFLHAIVAHADNALKVWDYAPRDVQLLVSKGNAASLRVSPDVKTPEGRAVLELGLSALAPEAAAHDIQLVFAYTGGLRAGRDYEINFLCKSSAPGVVRMAASQAGPPWDELPGASCSVETSRDWQVVKLPFTARRDWLEPLAMPRLMFAKFGAPAVLHLGPVVFRELPKLLPLALNKEWSLSLGMEERKVELKDNVLDIARLAGGFKPGNCATLHNQFDSPEAGRMCVGVAADWFLEVHVNGEKVFSDLDVGNSSHAFTPDDQVFEFPVKKGKNVLTAKVLSGSQGWLFVCGAPTRAADGLFTARPGPDWKPVDMDKLLVKAGTALDFSALAGGNRPAGELGRVVVNPNGRLAFEKEPGRPVRFLAFNTVVAHWRAAFHTWTKQDIDAFAAAVARQGYNMLRLQAVDRFLIGWKRYAEPRKSMGETGIPQKVEDIPFDAGCVDRFDYLLACLKKHGVYVNLDIMTGGKGYTASDGSNPSDRSFRVQLFFNPEYRKHWEVAMEWLMSHRNPYTGIALKDDPALAILEPVQRTGHPALRQAHDAGVHPVFPPEPQGQIPDGRGLAPSLGPARRFLRERPGHR